MSIKIVNILTDSATDFPIKADTLVCNPSKFKNKVIKVH